MMMMIMIIAINVKHEVYKTVIGDVVAHQKPQKNLPFRKICNVLFHHYSAVPFYRARSDGTVHYKSYETVNFCGF